MDIEIVALLFMCVIFGTILGTYLESTRNVNIEKIESGEEFIVGKASYKAIKTNELLEKK